MREKSVEDIITRLKIIFKNKNYYQNLENPKVNWLNLNVDKVMGKILDYLEQFAGIKV